MSQPQGAYKTGREKKVKIKVKDESGDRKYFTITPRIVKAYSRNPYDFALWDAIKDVAGDAGECYLSTDDLAVLSGMSAGQVSKSRKYWISIGFLTGEFRRDPGYPQKVWHVSVPNLWQRNIEWCESHLKIAERMKFMEAQKKKSLHTGKPFHSDGGIIPGETKNNRKELDLNVNERSQLLTKLYKENIGAMVPLMINFLENAAIDYPDHTWYAPAFEIAVRGNGRSWNYVETVLKNWKEKGRGWSPIAEKYNGKGKKPAQSSAPEVEYNYDALREVMKQHEANRLAGIEAEAK